MGITDMIESSEGGVTIKPSLVWGILVTVLSGGLWVGMTVASINGTLAGMEKAEVLRSESLNEMRARIRDLEAARSANNAIVLNVQDDVRELKETFELLRREQGVTNSLLRRIVPEPPPRPWDVQ